jgi:hypothetical protein
VSTRRLSHASTTTAIESSGADLDGDGSVSSLDRLDSWLVLIRLVAFVPDVRSALVDAHFLCPGVGISTVAVAWPGTVTSSAIP